MMNHHPLQVSHRFPCDAPSLKHAALLCPGLHGHAYTAANVFRDPFAEPVGRRGCRQVRQLVADGVRDGAGGGVHVYLSILYLAIADQIVIEPTQPGRVLKVAGAGKPIPGLGGAHDEMWWLKQLLKREQLSVTPAVLAVRKELEDARERIAKQTSEDAVRRIVGAINHKIAEANATATTGPASTLVPLDEDRVVARWRAGIDSK